MAKRDEERWANGHKVKSVRRGRFVGRSAGKNQVNSVALRRRRLSTNLDSVLLLLASAVPFIARRWLVIGLAVRGSARQ